MEELKRIKGRIKDRYKNEGFIYALRLKKPSKEEQDGHAKVIGVSGDYPYRALIDG